MAGTWWLNYCEPWLGKPLGSTEWFLGSPRGEIFISVRGYQENDGPKWTQHHPSLSDLYTPGPNTALQKKSDTSLHQPDPVSPNLFTSLCQRNLFSFSSIISRGWRSPVKKKKKKTHVCVCVQKINTITGTDWLINSFPESADYSYGGETMLMN